MIDIIDAKLMAVIITHNRLKYYHTHKWISDKEFLECDTSDAAETGDVNDFLTKRGREILKDIREKEMKEMEKEEL